MILSTALLILIACSFLALSQDRHLKKVVGVKLQERKASKLSGGVLLILSFALLVVSEGMGYALLLWILLIACASFIVALVLSYKPTLLNPVIIVLIFLSNTVLLPMFRKISLFIIPLLLVGIAVSIVFRMELGRFQYQTSLFTGESQLDHFKKQQHYYPVHTMLESDKPYQFPVGQNIELPELHFIIITPDILKKKG